MRIPRYHGRVNQVVLMAMLNQARYVSAKVILNEITETHLGVDRADVIDEVQAAGPGEEYWVMWGGKGNLSIEPLMIEESKKTWPEEVWTDAEQEPPKRKKK